MSVVPANLPGLFWSADDEVDLGPESVRLVRTEDAAEIPFELTQLGGGSHEIRLLEPLAAEKAHSLVLGSVCGGTGLADETASVFTLMATAAAPLPEGGLGELIAGEPTLGALSLATINGGCAESVESAYIDVSVELDAAVVPWRDALMFETLVDGELWSPSAFLPQPPQPGESWRGRGVDRVYAMCAAGDVVDEGLSEGTHEVVIRARIPATGVVLASTKVTVELSCGSGGTSGAGEVTSTGDAPTGSDGGSGGSTGDGGSTGVDQATGGLETKTGCACRTDGDPFGSTALGLLVLVGLARRRRAGARAA